MTFLLDAHPVISFPNGRPAAVDLMDRLLDEGVGISTIVWDEVYEGLLAGREATSRIEQFEQFSTTTPLLAPDVNVARRYAMVRAQLRAEGRLIADDDLWIAATALAHGLRLVSRDRHFRRIPDLQLYPER